MKKPSFADLKLELEDACAFLQAFTLGRPGFTRQDGLAGIRRVQDHCNRLEELFVGRPEAGEAVKAGESARAHVVAAQARLALLPTGGS
jgi:hypothetical protein